MGIQRDNFSNKWHPPEREFLFEIGTLPSMGRGWRQHVGMDCASDSEHSFRVVFLALMLARKEGVKNEEKIEAACEVGAHPEDRP